MKKPKKHHLGESLNDIMKKQEETEVNLPDNVIGEAEKQELSDSVDLISGDEFHDLNDEEDALTIVEDLHDATMHILENQSERDVINKEKGNIISKKEFNNFSFLEYEEKFHIEIKRSQGKTKKEILEKAFLEIITEISDIEQFL